MASYYGWKPDYIDALDCDTFFTYNKAIEAIEAQDILLRLKVADWPNMKQGDRDKFFKEIRKKAYPLEKPTVLKFDELDSLLR